MAAISPSDQGDWVCNNQATLNQDFVTHATLSDAVSLRQNQTFIVGRLGDTESERTGSDFTERWRRFLACLNFFQFVDNFRFWASSETGSGSAPEIPLAATTVVSEEWQDVLNKVMPSMRPYVPRNGTCSTFRFRRVQELWSTSTRRLMTMFLRNWRGFTASLLSPFWLANKSLLLHCGNVRAGKCSRPTNCRPME